MRRYCQLALMLAVVPMTGQADTVVRRCVLPDGSTLYTDQPCDQRGAVDAPKPSAPAATQATQPDDMGIPDSLRPLASFGPANEDCARTPDALLTAIKQHLHGRDINGLAGLYHWPGMGTGSARAVMDRLETLLKHSDGQSELVYPDAAFVVFNPQAFPDLPPEDPIAVRIGVLPDALNPLPGQVELRVIRASGCWWLHF